MGIFTRFRDIINSNISAMLDKAEDPEKLIQLMVREMEDTLVELKASCAEVIAAKKSMQRRLEYARSRKDRWEARANLAVGRGRDDLAREALTEKHHLENSIKGMQAELEDHQTIVRQYHDDIQLLEEKLTRAREKQYILTKRHIRARQSIRAREEIRKMDNFETFLKFDEMESRIERMEAEADMVGYGYCTASTVEEEFDRMIIDEAIEEELAALKAQRKASEAASASASPDTASA
jgi:phage shock protein A